MLQSRGGAGVLGRRGRRAEPGGDAGGWRRSGPAASGTASGRCRRARSRPATRPPTTALREVAEETGLHGRLDGKLGDVRYVYTWKGERIFKVVSFFLVRYERGEIGDVPPEFAHEIEEARWLPLPDAVDLLAYKGEREMAREALSRL